MSAEPKITKVVIWPLENQPEHRRVRFDADFGGRKATIFCELRAVTREELAPALAGALRELDGLADEAARAVLDYDHHTHVEWHPAMEREQPWVAASAAKPGVNTTSAGAANTDERLALARKRIEAQLAALAAEEEALTGA